MRIGNYVDETNLLLVDLNAGSIFYLFDVNLPCNKGERK
jgi:hypothetical protein